MRAGWFPIKVEALPEGTCVHAHVPVYQVPRRTGFIFFSCQASR